ncbi:glycosyltransferase [Desulfoplanes formicivorans]|uniref:Glycosyltransferase 2-like domain-containing protein n=1 Tax=Desulfoplanes formicivorans TaxID=1592317 RepID=A0A194AJY2_9BACT|nr:glycosyltransferase [Desulfoplanes formicivorans]GAU09366.1 hypothetical protein DPF_2092 [Desulfoplanes formicivorans]
MTDKKNENKRPLVTFALFAYNHEEFIHKAVIGALSQTYSPLEIILSDDCSSDSTFEIMQKMAAEYNGPHTVILNRNEKNLGIGGHVNKVMDLSTGELIVAAAGDDISYPIRVETLVDQWSLNNYVADSLHSQVMRITKDGKYKGSWKTENCLSSDPRDFVSQCIIIGASHAWTRRVFERFGHLNTDIIHEDRTIGFRSSLSGGVLFVDKPLVRYREGGISQNGYTQLKINLSQQILHAHILLLDCMQQYKDYIKINNNDVRILSAIQTEIEYNMSSQIVAINSDLN